MSDPNNAGLIELRLDEGSFAIQGSASGLELAIANLLQNAVKAVRGKEAPCVLVTLGAQGQPPKEVVLSVEDNGPEISDEIFESMQAPSQSFSSKGLGFGLSIVRSIAEDHFGRLELARKPGGGLRAALVIPLERRNDDV
ncbi:ATP-binding protein [Sutterella massiliensis]|uniref:histidine kinase n=2 Tax=Sutterella massiliensis TaxID=1816689 RepID=A0ABS2DUW9_9BURK|nr:ATP-binding protein [Sutterella massiliensis]